jgi:hypothetical protein
VHVELEHTGVPPVHACPHALQLFLSLVVSTQAPLHRAYPLLQVTVQVPAEHAGVA